MRKIAMLHMVLKCLSLYMLLSGATTQFSPGFPTKSRTLGRDSQPPNHSYLANRIHTRVLTSLSKFWKSARAKIAKLGKSLFFGSGEMSLDQKLREKKEKKHKKMSWKVRQMQLLEDKMQSMSQGRARSQVAMDGHHTSSVTLDKGLDFHGESQEHPTKTPQSLETLKERQFEMESRLKRYVADLSSSTHSLKLLKSLKASLISLKSIQRNTKQQERAYLNTLRHTHDHMVSQMRNLMPAQTQDLLKNFDNQRLRRNSEYLLENLKIETLIRYDDEEQQDFMKMLKDCQMVSRGDASGQTRDLSFFQFSKKNKIYDKRDYPEIFEDSFQNPEKIVLFLRRDQRVQNIRDAFLKNKFGAERKVTTMKNFLAQNILSKVGNPNLKGAEKLGMDALQNLFVGTLSVNKEEQTENGKEGGRENNIQNSGNPSPENSTTKENSRKLETNFKIPQQNHKSPEQQQNKRPKTRQIHKLTEKEKFSHLLQNGKKSRAHRSELNVYVKDSLKKLAKTSQGKRDMERLRELTQPGYIERQALRIVENAIELKEKGKEKGNSSGERNLREVMYLGAKGWSHKAAGAMREEIAGLMKQERSKLAKRIADFVHKDYEMEDLGGTKRPERLLRDVHETYQAGADTRTNTESDQHNRGTMIIDLENNKPGRQPRDLPDAYTQTEDEPDSTKSQQSTDQAQNMNDIQTMSAPNSPTNSPPQETNQPTGNPDSSILMGGNDYYDKFNQKLNGPRAQNPPKEGLERYKLKRGGKPPKLSDIEAIDPKVKFRKRTKKTDCSENRSSRGLKSN